jgi:hypothetical protein
VVQKRWRRLKIHYKDGRKERAWNSCQQKIHLHEKIIPYLHSMRRKKKKKNHGMTQ